MANVKQLLESFINDQEEILKEYRSKKGANKINDYERGWLDGWYTCKQIMQAIYTYDNAKELNVEITNPIIDFKFHNNITNNESDMRASIYKVEKEGAKND